VGAALLRSSRPAAQPSSSRFARPALSAETVYANNLGRTNKRTARRETEHRSRGPVLSVQRTCRKWDAREAWGGNVVRAPTDQAGQAEQAGHGTGSCAQPLIARARHTMNAHSATPFICIATSEVVTRLAKSSIYWQSFWLLGPLMLALRRRGKSLLRTKWSGTGSECRRSR